jgi:hypothetical protein
MASQNAFSSHAGHASDSAEFDMTKPACSRKNSQVVTSITGESIDQKSEQELKNKEIQSKLQSLGIQNKK